MKAGTARGGKAKGGNSASSAARLAAVQSLYEIEISGASLDSVLLDFLEHRWEAASTGELAETGRAELAKANRGKFAELIRGVTENKTRLDDMLAQALAPDNEGARLDLILKTILRAGAWELAYRPRVPLAVIIDEYVELSHAFHGGNEPKLVNGVLDRLGRILRPSSPGEDPGEKK